MVRGIIGIGTDIEQIERFSPARCTERLKSRVFTPDEIAYCESQARPERHYAARFAAKEATVKALARQIPRLTVSRIEVLRSPEGIPSLRVLPRDDEDPMERLTLHVSLSHSGGYATAFVVAEWVSEPAV